MKCETYHWGNSEIFDMGFWEILSLFAISRDQFRLLIFSVVESLCFLLVTPVVYITLLAQVIYLYSLHFITLYPKGLVLLQCHNCCI